ncbi:MAG: LamG-like jellyroll fold domain-containing protein [Chloroflexota bacterium]
MAASAKNVGAWADSNSATQVVTLPAHAAGDMLFVVAACKPYTADPTITNPATGWTRLYTYADGTVANGNGTGSVRQVLFYREAASAAETNPTVSWGTTSAPGIAVAGVLQKDAGDTWNTPLATNGNTTNATGISVSLADPGIAAGGIGLVIHTTRDNSALTVPSWTQTGATLGTLTEWPATAISSATSNDMAGDMAYRTVTTPGTGDITATGTQGAAETGVTSIVFFGVSVLSSLLEEMLSDGPTMLLRGNETGGTTVSDASGNGHDGTLQTGATFGATALVAADTSIDLDGSTGHITVPTGAWIDRADGAFTLAIVVARDVVENGELFLKGNTGGDAPRFGFDSGGQWISAGQLTGGVHTYSSVLNNTSRHMYVVTYDGTTHVLYEDGVDITDSTANPTYGSSTDAIHIGAAVGGTTLNLDGRVGYIAYFPTAISAARIAAWWASIDVAPPDNKVVTPATASLALTAYAPTVVVDGPKVVTPATASLALTAYAPTVSNLSAVGFGRNALSATARSDYHVTDGGNGTGAGTLRDALSASNRNIIFDVAAVTLATSELQLDNLTNIVIDGSSQSSGVTISGQALRFDGCRNIVIRDIAFRDCATQWEGALQFRDYAGTKSQDILVDHCSFSGFAWRGVDITEGTHHVTVQWCFFGPNGDYGGSPPAYNYPAYVGDLSDRVSFDHCLFYNGGYRQPGAAYDMNEIGSVPSFITMDVANCLIWSTQPAYNASTAPYGYFAGTTVLVKSLANVRRCYYHATAYTTDNHALYTERPASYPTSAEGFIYSEGNKFKDDAGSLVTTYTVGSPYSVESGAELVLESTATIAANNTLAGAGRFPRDATDAGFAANIILGTVVTPATASLALTAYAPTVSPSDHKTVTPGAASLTLTPLDPTVTASDHQVATPGVASLALAAFAPTVAVSDNLTVTPVVASLALSPLAPVVTSSDHQVVTPATASLALAPLATSVILGTVATPDPATLGLTAFAPDVTASDHRLVTPDPAALTLTTFAPGITAGAGLTVVPGASSLALMAFAPDAVVSDLVSISPAPRTLSLTAFAPEALLSDHRVVTPAALALALGLYAPSILVPAVAVPGAASLGLTAFAPGVMATDHQLVTPGSIALVLAAFAPTVTATGGGPPSGSIELGHDPARMGRSQRATASSDTMTSS